MSLTAWIVIVAAASAALAYLNSPGWAWLAAAVVALLAGLGSSDPQVAAHIDALRAINAINTN